MKFDKRFLRWRLNDMTEESRVRWTRVHRIAAHDDTVTACRIAIPSLAYDIEYGEWIPDVGELCKWCERSRR